MPKFWWWVRHGKAPCEEGELVHRGPLVAQGYWRDPAQTAERYKPGSGGVALWRYGGMVGRPGAA